MIPSHGILDLIVISQLRVLERELDGLAELECSARFVVLAVQDYDA
jgi:hypothetical protein